eukprot:6950299-Prymnesium_polylepis.1
MLRRVPRALVAMHAIHPSAAAAAAAASTACGCWPHSDDQIELLVANADGRRRRAAAPHGERARRQPRRHVPQHQRRQLRGAQSGGGVAH